MAAASTDNQNFNPELYLSPGQQDLLLAALSSNNPAVHAKKGSQSFGQTKTASLSTTGLSQQTSPQQTLQNVMGSELFDSPQQQIPGSTSISGLELDDSPFIDYDPEFDLDGSFDYDINGDGAQMIGALPGTAPSGTSGTSETNQEVDSHNDKRKSIEDDNDDETGGGKRREGDDRVAKKPGRKPLTSEPTSKRKAQNRAAQRAFRERKEKHLKDLETKVTDLEKASEAANHENGLLRAQVERLTTELSEYRKRLSLNGSSLGRSPPLSGLPNFLSKSNDPNNFQFNFPRFGALPGAHIFNNGSLNGEKPGKVGSVQAAATNGLSVSSPKSTPPLNRSTGNTPVNSNQNVANASNDGIESLNGLFSPSILESANRSYSNDYFDSSSLNFVDKTRRTESLQSNGRSQSMQNTAASTASTSHSPSASTASHNNAESSAATSPDGNTSGDGENHKSSCGCSYGKDGEVDFCEKLNMACGNPNNPVPRAMSMQLGNAAATPAKTPASDVHGIEWMAQQNGGQFSPDLFGNYREPQDAINSADFGGFFNDAYIGDLGGSPFNFNLVGSPQSRPDLMQEIDSKLNADDEEVVPGEDTSKMLSCTKIWDRLQHDPSFQSGDLDVDGLCTELRAKAKCSENGVVVDEKDVDDVLRSFPGKLPA